MQFRKEVQEQFRKAGWHPGRNVKKKFDAIPRFNEFPALAKEFLYEYGDLEVETISDIVTGILNTKLEMLGNLEAYLTSNAYYGNLKVFPLGYYDLDNAMMESDATGRIYMSSDGPNLMSNSFIEGIERVIMEDYSDAFWWDEEKKKWSQEDMFKS